MPTIEVGTHTDMPTSTTRGIKTEPVPLYTPLIVEATIQVVNRKIEEQP